MKKMEKHKKRDHNKTSISLLRSPSKLKRCYTEMVPLNDEERVEHYLNVREQKMNQNKYYSPKTVDIVKHEIPPPSVQQIKVEKVDSLDSDMTLDKTLVKSKNQSTTITNKNNDRLVIELKDYLALTKTRTIVKFKLKPIPNKPELSSVKDIIKTANTFQFNQILNYGQSHEEPQRTFLLVPQTKVDIVNKESKIHKKQVNGKKPGVVLSSELSRPVETFQKTQQVKHKKSSIPLSNVQKDSTKNVCVRTIDTKYSEPKALFPIKKSRPVMRASKKVQSNNVHSNTDDVTRSLLKRKNNAHSNLDDAIESVARGKNYVRSNAEDATKSLTKGKKKVVLRSHPYFSKHKPFVIKHRPAVTNITTNQNDSVTSQEENLEIDLDSVFKNNELIDDIKFEVPDHELNFIESESIDQIFPVALKSTDSDDFEYLGFETTNDDEISTETDEMQILGI